MPNNWQEAMLQVRRTKAVIDAFTAEATGSKPILIDVLKEIGNALVVVTQASQDSTQTLFRALEELSTRVALLESRSPSRGRPVA
jgi:chaperonin cofactor prefoldin